jgi:hypothetical protein
MFTSTCLCHEEDLALDVGHGSAIPSLSVGWLSRRVREGRRTRRFPPPLIGELCNAASSRPSTFARGAQRVRVLVPRLQGRVRFLFRSASP